jgi:Uma2 family endonuclease
MTAAGEAIVPRIDYPTRDGRPIAEGDQHQDEMLDYVLDVLDDYFANERRVYVSSGNFLYFTEGVVADRVCPDAYVVKGVPNNLRDTFKVWEEGHHKPCFVLEVTSKKTRHEDLGDKMAKYRDDLAVPEYFLFDPRGEWIAERLRGYVLEDGVYQPLRPDARGRLASAALGLELGVDGEHVRFFSPGARAPLPTAEERATRARDRALRAEAEVRKLRAEVARLRSRKRRSR